MGRTAHPRRFLILCLVMCVGGGILGYVGAGWLASPAAPIPPTPSLTPTLSVTDAQSTADYWTNHTSTIEALRGGLLLEDPIAFSSSEEESDILTIKNTEKGLLLTAKQTDYKVFTIFDKELPSDVDATVTAQGLPPDPCDLWSYSLVLRQQINGNRGGESYDLIIQDNKVWNFRRYDPLNPDAHIFAHGPIDQNFDIHQPNSIRIVAVKNHFNLFIDGKQIGSVDDAGGPINPQNKVGVAVETCAGPVTTRFTNLLVKVPSSK